jgi:hypothetical protein
MTMDAGTGHIIGGPADPDYDGAVLTSDLAVGDLVLHVDDTADFDEDAAERDAEVIVGMELGDDGDLDPTTGTFMAYTGCDDDAGTVTLAAASTVAASSGDRVYIANPVSGLPVGELEVQVAIDNADTTGDALSAILDLALLDAAGDVDLSEMAVELGIDEDDQLIVRKLLGLGRKMGSVKGIEEDPVVATGPGDIVLPLTHHPMPGTLHVHWAGVRQHKAEWTMADDGWSITVADPGGVIEAGDELVAQYLYTDPATKPPPPPPTVDVIGFTDIFGGDTTVAVPAGTQAGDLLVLTMQAGFFTPSIGAAWLDTIYTDGGHWILGYVVSDGSTSYPITVNSSGGDGAGILMALRVVGTVTSTTTGGGDGPAVAGASSGALGVVALTGLAGTVAGGFSGGTTDTGGHWTTIEGLRSSKASVLVAVMLTPPVDGSWPASATLASWNAMTVAIS